MNSEEVVKAEEFSILMATRAYRLGESLMKVAHSTSDERAMLEAGRALILMLQIIHGISGIGCSQDGPDDDLMFFMMAMTRDSIAGEEFRRILNLIRNFFKEFQSLFQASASLREVVYP